MEATIREVRLYTDGACSGNPGPGGWGAILRCNASEKELSGGELKTTNNRMELSAVIAGLSALREKCRVLIYSDSKYIVDAVNLGWARRWKRSGWMRNKTESALNPDLWEKLLALLDSHETEFIWVKGHAGHPENERCDALAVAEAAKFKKEDY
ncbi:MAG: ribonuclease HI [Oscillospiraceae bacterium]|jgi:ribonuclease HI|nr:ribonuclease HI [Oscillospiraceae bacterium]